MEKTWVIRFTHTVVTYHDGVPQEARRFYLPHELIYYTHKLNAQGYTGHMES